MNRAVGKSSLMRPPPTLPTFVKPDPNERAKTRPSTKRADYEGGWQRVAVPSTGNVKVFATTRRWRGIDVFIAKPTFDAAGANPLLRFKIFAIVEGMDRVLVATGIYKHNAPGGVIYNSTWVAGARCAADHFEVEMSCSANPTNPGVDSVDVGVIATDELVDLPPNLGACPIFDLTQNMSTNRGPAFIAPLAGDPPFELVAVHASRAAAAATRWFQLFDLATNNPVTLAAAGAPLLEFGMPNVGDTILRRGDELNAPRFYTGITAAISSNGAAFSNAGVANGDVAWAYWFR